MIVVLRDSSTGRYYMSPHCWVSGRSRALDLKTVARAIETSREEALEQTEAVARFGQLDGDWVIPIGLGATHPAKPPPLTPPTAEAAVG